MQGARGVLVFDGAGADEQYGPLAVRYAPHADELLERLAAEHRDRERVCLVSSDAAVRGTSGQQVMKLSSRTFCRRPRGEHRPEDAPRSSLVRPARPRDGARLERLRRGELANIRSYQAGSIATDL